MAEVNFKDFTYKNPENEDFIVGYNASGTAEIRTKFKDVANLLTANGHGATGPQGPRGLRGPAGAAGVAGVAGNTGETGAQGATGPIGPMGFDGARGETGPQGPAGSGGSIISFEPPSSTSAGVSGTIAYANNYIYMCVAPNVWKRAMLATWD